jgi:hypothetical protein
VFSKSKIFKFLKRDCGTIPVAEITNGKIEFFSKHRRFLIATESSKYLLIFVLYFIAEYFEGNFESKENDTQILKNVNRHIYLCKQTKQNYILSMATQY